MIFGVPTLHRYDLLDALLSSADERFWPAYYEDMDYNHRLRLSGIRTGVVPPPDFHGGCCTRDSLPQAEAQFIHDGSVKNQEYYTAKWGGPPGAEQFAVPFGP